MRPPVSSGLPSINEASETSHVSRWLSILRQLPSAALATIAGLLIVAVFGDLIAPHDMYAMNLMDRLKPTVWMEGGTAEYLLGTDALGRDILSRLIGGARTSLIVALVGLVIGGVLGGTAGIVAGYFGGRIDMIIMRLTKAGLHFWGDLARNLDDGNHRRRNGLRLARLWSPCL